MIRSSYNSYSDEELADKLKQGDLSAFTAIHERYYGILYAHAYKRFPDREEVRDILQELFTSIWNNRDSISFNMGLPAYLYTAVRNKILNVYKRQKIRSDHITSFQKFVENTGSTPHEIFRVKELIAIINAEIVLAG